MRTTVLVLMLLCCLTFTASSQVFKIGPAVEYASPLSTFGDHVKSGFGGAAQLKLDLPFISVLGAIDYIKFSGKDVTVPLPGGSVTTTYSADLWGLNAGVTFGLFPMVYAGAEVGTYFVTNHAEVAGTKTDDKVTLGAFAPVVGVSFSMFDVSARYEFLKDSNFLLIRAAVLF